MIATSALYKSILANRNHTVEWKITVNDVDYTDTKINSSVAGGDSLPRISRQLFSGSTPEVGACVSSRFACALFEASANIPRMASVKPFYRLILGSHASEWIQKGEYFIDTRAPDAATGTLVLQCYDAMLKADGEGGKPYAQLTQLDTWPQTMAAVAADIADIMGVTLDPRNAISSGAGYMVEYPNDYTMREVLGFIGAAHGACWTMTDAGKLRLLPITGSSDSVGVGWALTALTNPPALTAWSGCEIYYADEQSFSAGDDSGQILTAVDPWATQATANGLLQVISGVAYQPFTAEGAVVDLAAELGDVVTLGGENPALTGSVTGPIFSMEITCDAGSRCRLAAPGEEELDHEYPYASQTERTLRRKVSLAVPYYGVTISREHGIEIKRSDGASEAIFNSDVFAMRARIDGQMKDRIYFDPVKGDYVFDGALGADAVFTDALYAQNGDIADLTVDRLITSRRVRKYILGDTSDDNYIHIQDQYIKLITGKVNFQVYLLTESGEKLVTENDIPLILETDGGVPPATQLLNRSGQPLYWQREPVSHTPDGYPLDADGVQIYSTTDVTDWPVMVYDYVELVKSQYAFDQIDNEYTPQLVLGAGYGDTLDPDKGKGFIRKNTNSFDLWLHTASGEDHGIFIGEEYTDIVKLRKTTVMDFSGWGSGSFSETIDGGATNTYTVNFDGEGRPVKITDGEGHETAVIW